MNFAVGTIISELQIFTQPVRAMKSRDEYRRRYESSASVDSHVRFIVLPLGDRLMLAAGFYF